MPTPPPGHDPELLKNMINLSNVTTAMTMADQIAEGKYQGTDDEIANHNALLSSLDHELALTLGKFHQLKRCGLELNAANWVNSFETKATPFQFIAFCHCARILSWEWGEHMETETDDDGNVVSQWLEMHRFSEANELSRFLMYQYMGPLTEQHFTVKEHALPDPSLVTGVFWDVLRGFKIQCTAVCDNKSWFRHLANYFVNSFMVDFGDAMRQVNVHAISSLDKNPQVQSSLKRLRDAQEEQKRLKVQNTGETINNARRIPCSQWLLNTCAHLGCDTCNGPHEVNSMTEVHRAFDVKRWKGRFISNEEKRTILESKNPEAAEHAIKANEQRTNPTNLPGANPRGAKGGKKGGKKGGRKGGKKGKGKGGGKKGGRKGGKGGNS